MDGPDLEWRDQDGPRVITGGFGGYEDRGPRLRGGSDERWKCAGE